MKTIVEIDHKCERRIARQEKDFVTTLRVALLTNEPAYWKALRWYGVSRVAANGNGKKRKR